jgi:integrase
LDETGVPLGVQQKLMRHASIRTPMNIYGKAMTESKRQTHSKIVEMVLNRGKSTEKNRSAAIGS